MLILSVVDAAIATIAGFIGVRRLVSGEHIGQKLTGAVLLTCSAMFAYFSISNYRNHQIEQATEPKSVQEIAPSSDTDFTFLPTPSTPSVTKSTNSTARSID